MSVRPDKSLRPCLPPQRAGARVLADLAPLLAGKVPVDRALRLVASQQKGRGSKQAALALEAALREGRPLSHALARMEEVFGSSSVAAARAGESSGDLAGALGRYVEHLHNQEKLRRKMASAMAYPAVVCSIALAAVSLLVLLVVPRMAALLESLGGDGKLPLPTRILLWVSDLVGGPAPYVLAGLTIACVAALSLSRRGGESLLSALVRRLPLVGTAMEQGALARACATLASLSRAGVPLPDCIGLAGNASGDIVLAGHFDAVAREVSRGIPLSAALGGAASGLGTWPGMDLVREASALGEETGELHERLEWAAHELESRTEARTAALSALLEPALVVMMAVVVGLVALALFLPILTLADRMAGR